MRLLLLVALAVYLVASVGLGVYYLVRLARWVATWLPRD